MQQSPQGGSESRSLLSGTGNLLPISQEDVSMLEVATLQHREGGLKNLNHEAWAMLRVMKDINYYDIPLLKERLWKGRKEALEGKEHKFMGMGYGYLYESINIVHKYKVRKDNYSKLQFENMSSNLKRFLLISPTHKLHTFLTSQPSFSLLSHQYLDILSCPWSKKFKSKFKDFMRIWELSSKSPPFQSIFHYDPSILSSPSKIMRGIENWKVNILEILLSNAFIDIFDEVSRISEKRIYGYTHFSNEKTKAEIKNLFSFIWDGERIFYSKYLPRAQSLFVTYDYYIFMGKEYNITKYILPSHTQTEDPYTYLEKYLNLAKFLMLIIDAIFQIKLLLQKPGGESFIYVNKENITQDKGLHKVSLLMKLIKSNMTPELANFVLHPRNWSSYSGFIKKLEKILETENSRDDDAMPSFN